MMAPRLDNQDQRSDRLRSVVRLRDRHGIDVHDQRRQPGRTAQQGRPAEGDSIGGRQRVGHQPLQTQLVVRIAGAEQPVVVRQPVTAPEDPAGTIINLQDPPAPVQVDDANPGIIKQGGHGRVAGLRADQRLPDADELSNMGHEPPDHRDLRRPPAIRGDGISERPSHAGGPRPVQEHVEAILILGLRICLVVGTRGFQFLGRVQVFERHQMAVGQLQQRGIASLIGW